MYKERFSKLGRPMFILAGGVAGIFTLLCAVLLFLIWTSDPLVYAWDDLNASDYVVVALLWPFSFTTIFLPQGVIGPGKLFTYFLFYGLEAMYLGGLFYSLILKRKLIRLAKICLLAAVISIAASFCIRSTLVTTFTLDLQQAGIGCGWTFTRTGEECYWNPFNYFVGDLDPVKTEANYCSHLATMCRQRAPFVDASS